MALSENEARNIGRQMAEKVFESEQTCVSAGILLAQTHDSFNKATPIIFRDNLKGLVSESDLKLPHSELAMHAGAAGKQILAFALTGTQSGIATYDKGSGQCQFLFGREDELFSPELVKQVGKMWQKRGPGPPVNPQAMNPTMPKPSRGDAKVFMDRLPDRVIFRAENVKTGYNFWAQEIKGSDKEVRQFLGPYSSEKWEEAVLDYLENKGIIMSEKRGPVPPVNPGVTNPTKPKPTRENVDVVTWSERDRLHIGIQDKETGDYYADWWDDEARQMFEDGFFKPGVPQYSWEKPGREFVDSVLQYAEDIGILAK